jgi:SsrA-binding protein
VDVSALCHRRSRYASLVARAKTTIARRAAAREETGSNNRLVASNRRARHEYEILETYECGIVLSGSEVKSLRQGKAQLADAYARVVGGELWLYGLHIPPWEFATGVGAHEPDRRRKLLVHRREIDELMGRTQQQSLTLVPLSLYFRDGLAKVQLALARGRKLYDKRQAIARRDADREAARAVREATRRG